MKGAKRTAEQMQGKFLQEGAGLLSYGGLNTFFGGIEAIVKAGLRFTARGAGRLLCLGRRAECWPFKRVRIRQSRPILLEGASNVGPKRDKY